MTQSEIISKFKNSDYYEKFNQDFFRFSEDEIIEALKKIILSCQCERSFTIKVESFEVIENYDDIWNILRDREYSKIKDKSKRTSYDFINVKESDIKLLVVNYYIAIGDENEHLTVYIAVPRVVDKFYFRISGNLYSAMHQIVDASTYNNAGSNSNNKLQSIVLKTMFMPIRIHRQLDELKQIDGEPKRIMFYRIGVFSKTISIFNYFLANFGWYGTLQFFNIGSDIITISNTSPESIIDASGQERYCFMKNDIYVSSPKYIFDCDAFVQSIVHMVLNTIDKNTEPEDLFSRDFWIAKLGEKFSSNAYEKGLNILDSLTFIYDRITKEDLHLPDQFKCDIYHVLKWMLMEFNSLYAKDNLDISIKRIRKANYIASLYAIKLARGIYRISDVGKKAKLSTVRRAIYTKPMYLLDQLVKCSLINYKNMVNDLDALMALKFTYKGIAGLGNGKSPAVPEVYKQIHTSHLGRVDLDSSSASDPGVTGLLCPLAEVYDGNFSEFEEPCSWESRFMSTVAEYRSLVNAKEAIVLKEQLVGIQNQEKLQEVTQKLELMGNLLRPVKFIDEFSETDCYELTPDSHIEVSYE